MVWTEQRRFELEGRDEAHLRQRLTTFRAAVDARGGRVMDIRWAPGTRVALVVYALPVARGLDVPARSADAGGA
jgi:hypothetical protein